MAEQKEIRVIVIDHETSTVEERMIVPSLDTYYDIIGCRCIDVVRRSVRGFEVDVICDDEALLRDEEPVPAMSTTTHSDIIFGKVIICDVDDEGREIGLDDEKFHAVMYAIGSGVIRVPEQHGREIWKTVPVVIMD